MEYSTIGDLNMLKDKSRPRGLYFEEAHLRKWMCQLAEALMYIHSKGVYHGAIRPEAIVVFGNRSTSQYKYVKLGEFGLQDYMEKAYRSQDQTFVTEIAPYLAPEVIAKYEGKIFKKL